MPERTQPVTAYRAVQDALPNPNRSINHTESSALHEIEFIARLAPRATLVATTPLPRSHLE